MIKTLLIDKVLIVVIIKYFMSVKVQWSQVVVSWTTSSHQSMLAKQSQKKKKLGRQLSDTKLKTTLITKKFNRKHRNVRELIKNIKTNISYFLLVSWRSKADNKTYWWACGSYTTCHTNSVFKLKARAEKNKNKNKIRVEKDWVEPSLI